VTEEGRKANGQFAKGNKIAKNGNGGRPPKKREERYYEIAMSACTFGDWKAIWKTAVEQAKEGDATARKWLSDYLMGPPTQKHDLNVSGGLDNTIRVIGGIDLDDDV
jgi:hypothetical protein